MSNCAYCGRSIKLQDNRFSNHAIVPHGVNPCPMGGQIAPVVGHDEMDYELRALLVTDLAGQLRDFDPVLVWTYLTSLPAPEVQRLLMIALSAVPTSSTLRDTFTWVADLPIAQEWAA